MAFIGGKGEVAVSETPETNHGGKESAFRSELSDKFDKLFGDDKLEQKEMDHTDAPKELSQEERQSKFDALFGEGEPCQKAKEESKENRISEAKDIQMKGCPVEGNGGTWDGERGNSKWLPDRGEVPKNPLTNPNGLTWGEILDKYGIDGIQFEDGEPDFSDISKGEVQIDDFTDDRGSNFDQADEKLAEQHGCTPEEVEAWRRENGYTWHECRDCETMQKVPREVHGNISHYGGISGYKSKGNS